MRPDILNNQKRFHPFFRWHSAVFGLLFWLLSVPDSQAAAVKIMPLGDSITHGFNVANSYRRSLWKMLTNSGYNVNFVGSLTTGFDGPVPNPDFDLNHEGHGGFTTSQILANIDAWAAANTSDVVLLHIGTNDAKTHRPTTETTNLMAQLIDRLRIANPNVKILLAQIIPLNPNGIYNTPSDWPFVLGLNQAIPALVAAKTTGPSPVILIDQFTDFHYLTDHYDGLHPNSTGEDKMAVKWFTALQSILTTTGNPPPSVSLTLPLHYTNFLPGANVPLAATAADSNGSVTNVEFYAGATKLGQTSNAPFQMTWSNVSAGIHSITTRAFDNAGLSRTSFSRTISVNNGSGWSMGEGTGLTANDGLGLTNHATLQAGVTWTNGGRIGGGLSFNGTATSYLQVAASEDIELAGRSFSVALWVRTSKAGPQNLIERQQTGVPGLFLFAINRDGVVPGKISVYNGNNWVDSVGGNLANGQWHHLAVTYDRINYRLYIDGVLDSIVADDDFILNSTQPWTFGRFNTLNAGWEFQGLMDEVRIVQRALTGLEIAALASSGSNLPPVVAAGPTQFINLPAVANLPGSASDDGLPTNGLVTTWSQASGPGTVGFANPGATNTTASFSAVGIYVLQLRATDGQLSSTSQVSVVVGSATNSWWPMDEGSGGTASDLSQGNHATLRNTTGWSTAGRLGGATSLNGTSNYLEVADSENLEVAGRRFTVALWVKTTKTSAQMLVEKQHPNFAGIFLLAINRDNVAPGRLSVFNGISWVDSVGGGLTNGQWHHVAVTYDRTSFRLYRDGVLDSTHASSESYGNTALPWTFGKFITLNVGWEFGGLMDEVRIYQRTLSNLEIAALVAPPTAQTLAASGVTSSAATLNGSLLPTPNPATAYFQWGATAAYGATTSTQYFPGGGTNTPFAISLSGLPPGSTWHYRAVVTNGLGSSFGADQTFTTLAAPPAVITLTASNVTSSNATLRGTVTANAAATGAYFQFGTTTNYSTTTSWQNYGASASNALLSLPVSGLLPATLYHFRIAATNSVGTNYGEDLTFTTAPLPNQPPLVSAGGNQEINLSELASLSGSVTDDGLPSNTVSIAWSLLSGPGSVTFANSNAPVTTASFSTNGIYELMLAASDGALSTQALVFITVREPLRFSHPFRGSNGAFGFRLTGPAGASYFIEHSTTFSNWLPLVTIFSPLGVVDIIDPDATNGVRRIYRSRLAP